MRDIKVYTKCVVVKCNDAFTRIIEKNEELFDFARKTENLDAACINLEQWLEFVTKKYDENIAAA